VPAVYMLIAEDHHAAAAVDTAAPVAPPNPESV